MVCPLESDASDIIKIDLDEECSLPGFQKTDKKYYQKVMNGFNIKCVGKEHCFIDVLNKDWPAKCRKKFGLTKGISIR